MTAKKPDYPADDPYGHITEALSMGESFQGARELFLAWVLRLLTDALQDRKSVV